MTKIYRVTGCGVTLIGPDNESLRWAILRMIARGETPIVEEIL